MADIPCLPVKAFRAEPAVAPKAGQPKLGLPGATAAFL
jgi:hypothetical protein